MRYNRIPIDSYTLLRQLVDARHRCVRFVCGDYRIKGLRLSVIIYDSKIYVSRLVRTLGQVLLFKML